MPNRLRRKAAKVSFFAFQDMITTVAGVLMIVMLLLSLDVTQRAAEPAEQAREQLRRQVEQARAELTANLEMLRRRQSDLALTNRVFVVPESSRKEAVLIVLSATNSYCSRSGQSDVTAFRSRSVVPDFQELLAHWDATAQRLVFYVRPSGVALFEQCRALALQRGFEVGYDAAEEDRHYVLLGP